MTLTRSQCSFSGIAATTGHVRFLSCHNVLPQPGWFKTTGMYSFLVLESEILNQGVGRAVLPLKPPGKNLSMTPGF